MNFRWKFETSEVQKYFFDVEVWENSLQIRTMVQKVSGHVSEQTRTWIF